MATKKKTAKKIKAAVLSVLVDGAPLPSVVKIKGDGVAFATLTIRYPGQSGVAWSISTDDTLLPLDESEGVLDENGEAVVYFGPTRAKGDVDFKVVVRAKRVSVSARFF